MEPETARVVTEAIKQVPTNGDPTLEIVKWLALVVILVFGAIAVVMKFINAHRKDSAEAGLESSVSSLSGALYTQLSAQLESYRKIADDAFTQRNELLVRVTALEGEVRILDELRQLNERLRERLDAKDAEIRTIVQEAKEERLRFLDIIKQRDKQVQTLGEQVSALTKRISDDEARCIIGSGGSIGPSATGSGD